MSADERLAVIGDPVAHSLSPAMQTAALAAAGLSWTYEAVRVVPAELPQAVERLRATTRGFNVTIPHKMAVRQHLDQLSASAIRVGAVNTVVRVGERLIGHNTDLAGFTAALLALEPAPQEPALIFGAGGAGRAVAFALADLGLPPTIVNRNPRRAMALAELIPGARALSLYDADVRDRLAEARIVVNTTSLGMNVDDPVPLPRGTWLRPDTVVMDLVYGDDTNFLHVARRFGCRTSDGLEMLVRQGAESFLLWTGLDPDLEVMRAACRRQLEEVRAC